MNFFDLAMDFAQLDAIEDVRQAVATKSEVKPLLLTQQPYLEWVDGDGRDRVDPFDSYEDRMRFADALLTLGEAKIVRYFSKPAPAAVGDRV